MSCSLGSALLCLIALPYVAHGSTLSGIVATPKFDTFTEQYVAIQKPRIEPLSRNGVQEDTAAKNFSQFLHIGCFYAPLSITKDAEQDTNFDPTACTEVCKTRYPNVLLRDLIAAVHGQRCGCAVGNIKETFLEMPDSLCTYPCKFYENPICGGGTNFWGVFKQYDYQSFASNGAFDPWRKIWYSTVVVRESSVIGDDAWNPDFQYEPERYYLHAVSVETGDAAFPYQTRLPGIVHGIQYDLDSTRLVGVLTSAAFARVTMRKNWEYELFVMEVNTVNITWPKILYEEENPKLKLDVAMSETYMAWTTNSAIYSRNGQDVFIFCQIEPSGLVKNTKSRVFFISIPGGEIIESKALDFIVLQLMANEKYGDVSAVGHRSGSMEMVMLAKIYLSELENAKKVQWIYNQAQPERLVPFNEFRNLFVHPGLAVSEHLFNKSYTFVRKYPEDWTQPRKPKDYPMILMEVSIRDDTTGLTEWCDAENCVGTVNYRAPYTQFFNKEPRIPLSLAAPSIVTARFSMEAVTINLIFDRATLKGALPLDTNNDIVPDIIDYSTQLVGDAWDCSAVFDQDSVLLLGKYPQTSCKWTADDQIQISLPRVFTIKVGDMLFLKGDTIYTIPRPLDNEYSMAASGGKAVALPNPLLDPVINFNGKTEIDECSDVFVYATDSYNVGGKATFRWALWRWKDLTNNPEGRIFNQTKLDLFKEVLDNATANNHGAVSCSSDYLEPATSFDINLTVTSRWELNSTKTITLTKLDFPAPMVSLLGPEEVLVNRTQQVSLLAIGIASPCSTSNRQLGYRWQETTGQLDLSAIDNLVYTTRSLVIPAFTLEPTGTGDDVNTYNFTVETFAIESPNKAAYASIAVKVRRSPVYVVLSQEDRLMQRGDILVIDARMSSDADYPTYPGHTFSGSFRYWCLTPDRLPCFGDDPDGLIPAADDPNEYCLNDPNQRFTVGGSSFSTPLFEEEVYCRWARGVLMVSTTNFTAGEYIFKAQCIADDGRTAMKDIRISITELSVPTIRLEIVEPMTKYPVTREIRVMGTIESELDPTQTIEFSWRVLVLSLNPAYDLDRAREAANDNDESTDYRVDKMIYQDQSEVYQVENGTIFFTRPDAPSMVIKENVLQPSQLYKIRLVLSIGGGMVEGYVDVGLETAGLPPRSGTLVSAPINATMDTARLLSAPDWVADDLPLTYQFGYIHYLGRTETFVFLQTSPLPVSQLNAEELPMGEPSTAFSVTLFVDVSTPFSATTRQFLQVYSLPSINKTAVIMAKFEEALTSDPETATYKLMSVLNVNQAPTPPPGQPPSPQDEAIMNEVIRIMEETTGSAPLTQNTATNKAILLTTVIDAGLKGDIAMNALEDLIQDAAAQNLFDINNPSLISGCLYAVGSILPEAGAPTVGAAAQSLGMAKYQHADASSKKYRSLDANEDFSTRLILSTLQGRQQENHPQPRGSEMVIKTCRTAYCDIKYLVCLHSEDDVTVRFTCCDSPNPQTLCDSPPCWFQGHKCPMPGTTSSVSQFRRLEEWTQQQNVTTKPAEPAWRWSDDLEYGGLKNGIHASRRLQQVGTTPGPTLAPLGAGELIQRLEEDEKPILRDVRAAIKQQTLADDATIRTKAKEEVAYSLMPAYERSVKKKAQEEYEEQTDRDKKEAERKISQTITRASVLRDTICKLVIVQLATSEPPMRFATPGFILYIGKTRNLSDVNNAFIFPDKYVVPATAPDYPTPTSSVTAFSFIFCEYLKNIYGWASSAPPGNQTRIITLHVMKASTTKLEVKNEPFPIRVFSDQTLYSSGLCMFWDRFAVNTAGGAWSPQGLLNNGDGCLTTHLSDIGLFVDGRTVKVLEIDRAISYYIDEVVDVGTNYSQMAICGFMLLLGTFCAMWGYIQDELMRESIRAGNQKNTFNLGGDGVFSRLTVLDPIAYECADQKNLFLATTFWHVIKRDHALLSPAFYHEVFTRPQRILCLGVLATATMAVNAIIYGIPGSLVSADQFIPSGVVSALLAYPLFVAVVFMFQTRPTPAKRRLVKKATNADQMEAIAKVRKELEAKSSLLPPPGYTNLPALPAPSTVIGGTTLLSLPPPMMSLPPAPPGMGTMGSTGQLGLPAPPRLPMTGVPGQGLPMLPGLPGLPPLPTLKATSPALGNVPPPPKYPQPPQRALTPGYGSGGPAALPPLPPGGGNGLPQLRATADGKAQPPPPPTATLAMPMPPGVLMSDAQHQAAPVPRAADDAEEAAGSVGRTLRQEAKHGMAPPLPPLSGPPPPPTGGMTPPGGLTPLGSVTPAGSQFATPRTPPPMSASTPASFAPATPKNMPLMAMQPMGVSRGIVHRGEPANFMSAPFVPPGGPPPGPPGMPSWSGGMATGMPSASGVPPPPPPPPPPPREDDPTFVRRVRLAYIDRAAKSHQQILQDEGQDVAWVAPEWVFHVTLMSPYIASSVSIACNVMLDLTFATKFGRIEESHWYYACSIGGAISLLILEIIRAAVTTVVELRKFEIRRRLVGGDFLKSRIRRSEEVGLKGRKPPPKKPAVPLQPPRNPPKSAPPPPPSAKPPVARPSFLPEALGPPGSGTGVPPFRTATGQGLPVGAPPPPAPPGSRGLPGVPRINMQASGRSPVTSARGGGFTPGTPGGASLLPGRLDATPMGTPKSSLGMPGGGGLLPGRLDGSRGPGSSAMPGPPLLPGGMPLPSPGGTSAVTGVTQALEEKLKASRVGTPPPPPSPGQGRSFPPSPSGAAAGRSAGGPPSRPNSRPTSHRSGDGSKTPPKPPTPPPPGTLQQTRALRRAQQDA